jgi:hypothetical protein
MGPIVDWLIDIDIAISDLQVESTLRVCANPGFVLDRGSLAAKIRKRHEVSGLAFLTLGEIVVRFQKPTSRPTITHSLYS